MVISRALALVVLSTSVAFAADGDGDGCDDLYEGNGACVDPTATVDGTSTVGANSEVGAYSSVGPGLALGANVIIAPRASIAGRDVHPSSPLPVGDGVIIGRRSTVGLDADLAPGTVLSRGVTTGRDFTTATGATVGYASSVGDGVSLGASATVGALVTLGDYTQVGANAVLARDVTIADAASSATQSVLDGIVGPGVSIGEDVTIQSGARVRKNATLMTGATLMPTARVGRDATVMGNATVFGAVGANATVGENATVESGARVARGGTVCNNSTVPGSATVQSGGTWPVEGCTLPASCLDILNAGDSIGDGIYSVDPDGSGAFDVYCDMDGGGWTLALRTAGSGNTFGFTSAYWTTDAVLNPASLDPLLAQDAKYDAFNDVPGTEIRGCLRNNSTGVYGCKDYTFGAEQTLLDLFSTTPVGSRDSGKGLFFTETQSERLQWLTMWGRSTSDSSTSPLNYIDTGINIDDDQSNYRARVRFGLALNNESSIYTLNDTVGFGAAAYYDSGTGGLVASPWRVSAGGAFGSSLIHTRGTIWVR